MTDIVKTVKSIMSEVFEINESQINSDSNSKNIESWDSLNHMNLIVSLEENYDVEIDEEDIPKLMSFQSIVEIIEKLKNEL